MISWFSFWNTVMSEIILSSSMDFSNMCHSSCAFSFSTSDLQRPIVHSHFFVGETASRTPLILNVISLSSTSSAQIVHFRMSFTETLSSLSFYHFDFIIYLIYPEINFLSFYLLICQIILIYTYLFCISILIKPTD